MTGQDLLNRMEDLDRELQLQSGETGVTRGLRALNAAQDYFETVAAGYPRLLGGQTGTITTTASTETTAYPTGLLRIDRLQMIDSATSRPKWDLEPIDDVGGHVPGAGWRSFLSSATGTGEPTHYSTDGASLYWYPLPNATYTVRWYGFQRRSDITASSTFAYDDGVALPVTVFAVELLRRGVDDPIDDYIALADRLFTPTIRALKRFRRERSQDLQYRYWHET